jgi:hypothetical protein
MQARGRFNQGDTRFSLTSRGKQCMANALQAIALSRMKPVSSWTTADIDEILNFGDKLYLELNANLNVSRYLFAKELPTRLFIHSVEFTVTQSEPISGLLFKSGEFESSYCSIQEALENALCAQPSNGCLVICSVYGFAIIKSDNKYYAFDSHSRDASGMSCNKDGRALAIVIGEDVSLVHKFVILLAQSLGLHLHRQCTFEVIPIQMQPVMLPSLSTGYSISSSSNIITGERSTSGKEAYGVTLCIPSSSSTGCSILISSSNIIDDKHSSSGKEAKEVTLSTPSSSSSVYQQDVRSISSANNIDGISCSLAEKAPLSSSLLPSTSSSSKVLHSKLYNSCKR